MTGGALQLVIGFSPGSASDIVARLLAAPLAQRLGGPVVVVPHPGDAGVRACATVAARRGAADVLLVATLGTHGVLPSLRPDLGYHPLADFEPVVQLAQGAMVLGVHPGLAAHDVGELATLARSRPGVLSYGTSAIGGAPHLAAALFGMRAGVDLRQVPYERTGDLYMDLAAGRIDLSFNNAMSMLDRIARGDVRGLATTGPVRLGRAPAVPTLAEAGVPDCVVTNWLGLVAPRGVAAARVASINAAVRDALQDAALRARLDEMGVDPAAGTPDAFGAHIAAELARWAPVVRTFHT